MKNEEQLAFIDLKAQQDVVREQLEERIKAVLEHGRYILGPEVQEFEGKLADFVGVKHCIGVSSGTDALLAVLMARGIGPGDAVFTTPFTFIATAEIVSLLGATPVFVDIDHQTCNIDPHLLKTAVEALIAHDPAMYPLPANHQELTPKAIIPVDLFGLPADNDPIMALARQYELFVLEDAAQGLVGVYKGKPAGSLGHAAATSFFPAKPLGCYGDGGAVLTDDDEIASRVTSIRVHGKGVDKYDNVRIGLNARLHTLQAAILLPKLAVFAEELEKRQHIAERYQQQFSACCSDVVTCPYVPEGSRSAWAQFSIRVQQRDLVQERLQEQGVPSFVYYQKNLHLQSAYAGLGYRADAFPVAEATSSSILSLPMHPYLKDGQIDRVVDSVKQAVDGLR